MYTPVAFLAPGFIGLGVSLLNYDPNKPESSTNQIVFNVSGTVGTFGGGGYTANQQYSITQGRVDTAQLQPYLDSIGTQYVYGGSGDIASSADGTKFWYVYTPNSVKEQKWRQSLIEDTYSLMVNASKMSELFKKYLKDFHDNYYIVYHDDPQLHLRGLRDNQYYNGAVRGSKTKFGYGIQYTDMLFEEQIGNGYMSEQYLRTFIHEVLHHKKWFGPTRYNNKIGKWVHPSRKNEFTGEREDFYFRVEQELKWFYQSYPPAMLID